MIQMSCSRSESVSNGRFVGAASIVPTGAAAVTPSVINVNSCGASSAHLCVSSASTMWEKTSERSLLRVAAVVTVLWPLTPIAVVAAAVGKSVEAGVPLLAFPEAHEDALLFLFLSFAVACLIGTVGSVIDAVREVFQGPQEPEAVGTAAAAAVVRPSTDNFSISHKMALKNDDGEEPAPPASAQDSKPVPHDPEQDKKKKRVAFGVVRIQEHAVILGTGNTEEDTGYPLTLDWVHAEETVRDLDAHEELMSTKTRKFDDPKCRARYLEPEEREERILEVSGVPLKALTVAEWRRLQQVTQQKYEDAMLKDEDEKGMEAPVADEAAEPVVDDEYEPVAAADHEEDDEQFPQEFEEDVPEAAQVDPVGEQVDPEEQDPEDEDVDDDKSAVAVPIKKKKRSAMPTTRPLRRSARLAAKPRINYKE